MTNYLSSLGFGGFLSFLFSLSNLMILLGLSADGPRPHGGGGGPHGTGAPGPSAVMKGVIQHQSIAIP